MNRWMLLRILVLGGGFAWAVWSLRDAPSVDLLSDSPLVMTPPAGLAPPQPGSALEMTNALQAASQSAGACGIKGTLTLKVAKGLERAEWRGSAIQDRHCLEAALWGVSWPLLPAPMELEWAVESASP